MFEPIQTTDNAGGPHLWRQQCNARRWPVKWQVVLIFLGAHLALGAAPFVYTNMGAILGGLLAWITVQFGMSLGYHRLISHRSYSTPRWLERLLALVGCLSAQSGPITWVAIHRLHHRSADHEPDPHTPLVSFLWAQCEWTFYKRPEVDSWDSKVRLAADVAADPFMRFLERNFVSINVTALICVAVAGYAWNGILGALSLTVWGCFVRLVVTWHLIFLINSAGHLWGYRSYDTPDNSRNVWWLAPLVFGDGWHNNHHADPSSAAHGHRWFEVDMTYWFILLLKWVGLATRVVRRKSRYDNVS
jgi:fatty-acid desaturase